MTARGLAQFRLTRVVPEAADAEAQEVPTEAGENESVARSADEEEGAAANVPRFLGRYEIAGVLGTGGMAVVYLARDPELQRTIAVKLVRASMRSAREAERERARLLKEAQLVARLNHPHVVTIHDVGVCDGQVFLAMEYVEGQNVREWWRAASRSRQEVLDVFLQAARGLAAAHAAGLVHRDFKPENVLVGRDGRVRVADFGLAGVEEEILAGVAAHVGDPKASKVSREAFHLEMTRRGHVVGTPRYMAPEQHLGIAATHRSDQFSFCIALYECLVGRGPFRGDTYEDLAAAVLMGDRDPLRPGEVPAWLERVLERGLNSRTDDRYPSMDGLIDDLETHVKYDEVRVGLARADLEGARVAYTGGARAEARAKLRASLEIEDSAVGRALWFALETDPLVWRIDLGARFFSFRFLTDGRRIAATGSDTSVHLLDIYTMETRSLRGLRMATLAMDVCRRNGWILASDLAGWVAVWTPEGDLVGSWRANVGEVYAAAFLPDATVVVGMSLGELRRFAVDGTPLGDIARLACRAFAVAASPHGRYLAAASVEGEVLVVDLEHGGEYRVLSEVRVAATQRFIAWAPDGESFATSTVEGNQVAIYRVGHGLVCERVLTGHGGCVSSARYTADGKHLVTGSSDRTLRRWNLATGRSSRIGALATQVAGLDLDPTERYLVAGRLDVSLWDIGSRSTGTPAEGHLAGVFGLAVGRSDVDGGLQAYSVGADGSLRAWDLASGRERSARVVSTEALVGLCVSSGGHVYVAGFDRMVRRCDAASLDETGQAVGHSAGVGRIRSWRGNLYTTGWDATLRLWDEATLECRAVVALPGMAADLAVCPDGSEVAVSGWAGWIAIVCTRTLDVRQIDGGVGVALGLAYRPDGSGLIWVGDDGTSVYWDRNSQVSRRIELRTSERVSGVTFAPDGHTVAFACTDRAVRLWSFGQDGVEKIEIAGSAVNVVAFTPDGEVLLAGCTDGTIHAIDMEHRRPLWRGIGLLAAHRSVATHMGLVRWQEEGKLGRSDEGGTASRWRDALLRRGIRACDDEDHVWIATSTGSLEVWDTGIDDVVAVHRGPLGPRLFVAGGLCYSHAASELRCYAQTRELWRVDGIDVVGPAGMGTVAVTQEGNLVRFDDLGRSSTLWTEVVGATAVAALEDRVVVGFRDGTLEWGRWEVGESVGPRVSVRLEERSSSEVTCLQAGPMGTVLVGYRSGVCGLWEPTSGRCLYRCKLHGSVLEARLEDGMLCALTELGATLVVSVPVFEWSYRELLARIWAEVPVTWKHGSIVEEAAPRLDALAGDAT